ncbi:ribosomal L7Ae/L30e/S12e/Gadd45 family protein [Candidatus Woesearchaeota archaeon]|nr:ribosomal L7Ae/L30e/S12e/Gadd45 family protein [Candidatus Woesearchaeota archaeon]
MAQTEPPAELEQNLALIKVKLQDGKAILGTAAVIKKLRGGMLESVFLARNCPDTIKNDLQHLAKLGNIPVEVLSLDNEELGVFCKKGFFISVLGAMK